MEYETKSETYNNFKELKEIVNQITDWVNEIKYTQYNHHKYKIPK